MATARTHMEEAAKCVKVCVARHVRCSLTTYCCRTNARAARIHFIYIYIANDILYSTTISKRAEIL